ncbi:hypothetical protein BX283_1557 [Streptomyces sp. TLI_146]|nr:hypothetical protein BX283_1557 [Streptomyces sp. TLI_146]
MWQMPRWGAQQPLCERQLDFGRANYFWPAASFTHQ